MRRPGDGTTPAGEWGDWLAPAEAWQRVRDVWQPTLVGQESVPLAGARGRVLAQDVRAPADSPAFDRSAMEGYAGDVPMGAASPIAVGPGQAAWVATGSMIPPGADSVVMVERTTRAGETVLLLQAAKPGDNVTRRGNDPHAGKVLAGSSGGVQSRRRDGPL